MCISINTALLHCKLIRKLNKYLNNTHAEQVTRRTIVNINKETT